LLDAASLNCSVLPISERPADNSGKSPAERADLPHE
jgi:hypothetical protein